MDPSVLNQDEVKPSAKVDLLHPDTSEPNAPTAAPSLSAPTLPSENHPAPPPPPPPPPPPAPPPEPELPIAPEDIGPPEQPRPNKPKPGSSLPGSAALSSVLDVGAPPAPPKAPPEVQAPQQEFPQTSGRRRGIVIVAVVAVILLAIGAGTVIVLRNQQQAQNQTPTVTPPTAIDQIQPSQLGQTVGSSQLTQGSATKQTTLTFDLTVPSSVKASQLTPQIEVEPIDKPFTNTPTASGQPFDANKQAQTLSVDAPNLTDGSYHWQARFAQGDQAGPWVAFNTAGTKTPDFSVDTKAPAQPTIATIGKSKFAGSTVKTTVTGDNRPVITGKAEPGTSLTLAVQPDQLSFTATADSSGNWTITPSSDIPNGDHTFSLIDADAAGNTSQLAFTATINPAPSPATAATTTPKTLAPTGDDTRSVSFLAAAVFLAALGCLLWLRRYGWR